MTETARSGVGSKAAGHTHVNAVPDRHSFVPQCAVKHTRASLAKCRNGEKEMLTMLFNVLSETSRVQLNMTCGGTVSARCFWYSI